MNDIFDFRKKLIDRYRSFSTSFANPRSADISAVVKPKKGCRFKPIPIEYEYDVTNFRREIVEEVKK